MSVAGSAAARLDAGKSSFEEEHDWIDYDEILDQDALLEMMSAAVDRRHDTEPDVDEDWEDRDRWEPTV